MGEAVTRAVYPALENPFAYPELAEAGLAAYKLPWLWLFAGPEERENHFVDVTDHVDSKLAAIHIHASQHPDVAAMDRTVRGLMLGDRGTRRAARRTQRRGLSCRHSQRAGTIAGF